MSGWSTITVEANSADEANEIADALDEEDDRDREAWTNEDEVRGLYWGYGTGPIALGVLKDHTDKWSDAIIMECNDTSDSGEGTYYTADGTTQGVEKVTHENGYEGARGHDAAGKLRDEAGFRPYMR